MPPADRYATAPGDVGPGRLTLPASGAASCRRLFVGLAAILAGVSGAAPIGAQTAPAPGAPRGTPLRTVLASRGLPTVVDAPQYFKLLRVQLAAGQSTRYAGANGFLYPLSGALEIGSESEVTTVREGEGAFLAAGRRATLKAVGGAPVTFLHFLLLRGSDLDLAAEGAPAVVVELYRSRDPIPGLKPGPYEFTLTRVMFPPRTPSNPPHHRSGAALYYITAGTGAHTSVAEGRTEARPTGSIQFEPHDYLHQWANPGDTPLVILQANISPEGSPVVIFPK